MTNTKLACFFLLASAFVLTAMLLVRVESASKPNAAQADQVLAQPQFSLMTARTRQGNESLFVLDNTSGTLLVYRPNFSRKQLETVTVIKMTDIFGAR